MIREISKLDASDIPARLRVLIITQGLGCLKLEITIWEIEDEPGKFVIQMNSMHPAYSNVKAVKDYAEQLFDRRSHIFRFAPSVAMEFRLIEMPLKDVLSAVNILFREGEIIMSSTTRYMLSCLD
jgi:hypothetical protein